MYPIRYPGPELLRRYEIVIQRLSETNGLSYNPNVEDTLNKEHNTNRLQSFIQKQIPVTYLNLKIYQN